MGQILLCLLIGGGRKNWNLSETGGQNALAITGIVLEEYVPPKSKQISFTTGGNAWDYCCSGWHRMEPGRSWSNKSASFVAVLPEETDTKMMVTYTTHPGANDTSVYYNGEYVSTLPHHDGFAQETIVLPTTSRSGSDAQTITFVTDGATTSMEYFDGASNDTRVLGIGVSEIEFGYAH